MRKRTSLVVEAGLMIAVAMVLTIFLKFSGFWAFGGAITFGGMVPLIVFAFRHGPRWGVLCGVCFGILYLLLGIDGLRGVSLGTFVASLFLDYMIAFGVLGLAPIFRKVIKNETAALLCGSAFVIFLRFCSHFFSGWFLWYTMAPEGMGAVAYSLIYNFSYLGPELVITCVILFCLSRIGGAKLLKPQE